MRLYLFIIFTLLFVSQSLAQQYNFRQYSIDQGLPRSGVMSIYEDSRGFLWIGLKDGGLVRFDGINFLPVGQPQGLTSTSVNAIFEDTEGFLWIGTQNRGLYKYNGDIFENITTKEGLSANYITAIVQDHNGDIWAATIGGGVCRIKTQKDKYNIQTYDTTSGLLSNNARALYADGSNVWIGTDGGLHQYSGDFENKYTTQNGLPDNQILSIFESRNSTIWVGTNNGVAQINKTNITTLTTSQGLINNQVVAFCQDLQDNIWFATPYGASKYDGEKFQNFTEQQGLSNNNIRCMLFDSWGNLWLGTNFGGMLKYQGDIFVTYTKNDGLNSNTITSLIYRNNELWTGSVEGITVMQTDSNKLTQKQVITSNEGLPNNHVTALFEDTYLRLWVATNNGLAVWDNKVIKTFTTNDKLTNNNILSIMQDRERRIWVGTQYGANCIKFKDFDNVTGNFEVTTYQPGEMGIGAEVSAFFQDFYGNIWIGSRDEGLTVLRKDTPMEINFPDSLKRITTFAYFDNKLWIGTDGNGIFSINLLKFALKDYEFHHYSQSDGLFSNHINQLMYDSTALWAGSEHGVDRITFKASGDVDLVNHYSYYEGFTGVETMPNAVELGKNGELWFGTVRGLVQYIPTEEAKNTLPPQLYINNIQLFFNDVDWLQTDYTNTLLKWFGIPNDLVLPYNKNHLTFQFSGINLTQPEQVKYRWRLYGYDDDWSPAIAENKVTYPNLPEGTYTFSLLAANENDVWTNQSVRFTFTIEPPIWKTFWFYLLCIIVFGASLFALIQWRFRSLQRAKVQLESVVAIRTHELQAQRDLVLQQKDQLEVKNKEITDSINYAQRIQRSILYDKRMLQKLLPQSFILYMPKDIVSGDFYWFSKQDKYILVAAADCTGHGVPGAFMSVIGHNLLEKIVNEHKIIDPGQILLELDKGMATALHHANSDRDTNEGMDIALCKIDFENNRLEFAGAFRPLFIVRHSFGQPAIEEIKPARTGIGGETNKSKIQVETSQHPFSKGERFYIFSDGYTHQFGGGDGKKYKSVKFKEQIIELARVPMSQQEQILETAIVKWRGNYEQVDDILVIGVEYD